MTFRGAPVSSSNRPHIRPCYACSHKTFGLRTEDEFVTCLLYVQSDQQHISCRESKEQFPRSASHSTWAYAVGYSRLYSRAHLKVIVTGCGGPCFL